MEKNVDFCCQSSVFQLMKEVSVKPFLPQQLFETLIYDFISSHLDYRNSTELGDIAKK